MSSNTLRTNNTLLTDNAAQSDLEQHAAAAPRWRDLLASEWLKFRSLRSTFAVLAATICVALFFAYSAAKQTAAEWPGAGNWMLRGIQPAHDAFFPPGFYAVIALIGTVGAQAIVSEHASGLVRTTFIAVPRRGRVMLAKAAVIAGTLTVVGVIVTAACWEITLAQYSNRITAYGWNTPGLAKVFTATVLLFPLAGLIGIAIGTIIRHTATVIFAMVLNFWAIPVGIASLDSVLGTHLFSHISNVLPENSWLFLTTLGSTKDIVGGHPSTTEAWISYAAWTLAATAIIAFVPQRRDV
jgi:ABC-2 type transport system permease protein